MYFQSLTRGREIGANGYLLDLDDTRIILDAGMHPKREGQDAIPNIQPLGYDTIDAVVVSHCHLDHVGSLPVVQRQNPRARVYMTEACGELASALLHNSVNVMTSKREELGLTDYPLFTHREIEQVEHVWDFRPVNKQFFIGKHDVSTRFYDAGHIMGSVGVLFEHGGKRIFYTGDVNFENQTLSVGAAFPRDPVDVLIMETTRGAVERGAYSRDAEIARLAEWVTRTIERGGSVMIPVFAMGKTQEVLMMLHLLRQKRQIPSCPLFIGGLSTKMTVIYDKFAGKVARQYPHFEILKELDLMVAPRRRKKELRYQSGCIFALSSGMMTEHTVSNKLAAEFLDNPKNSLLFVGYADPDSPAGKIRAAKRGDLIQLDPNLPPCALQCDVDEFDFSGHAVREDLRDFAMDLNPKQIFLVHGDENALNWFQKTLQDELPECDVRIPDPGDEIPI